MMKKNVMNARLLKFSLPIAGLLCTLFLVSCHTTREDGAPREKKSDGVHYGQLTNYGESRIAGFAKRLTHARSQGVHIVQLGDSHTAADFFSGQLRTRLQQRFGDGGPGFVSPLSVPGQRHGLVGFSQEKKAWNFYTSRKDDRADFPLGGFIAQPDKDGASATMKLFSKDASPYLVSALYRATGDARLSLNGRALSLGDTQGQWTFSNQEQATFPAEITASRLGNLTLGGWLIQRPEPGVMLTPLGINGATLTMVDKWQPGWLDTLISLKPDMVILAYGTNEAFNDRLDPAQYRAQLEQKIAAIRQALPDAPILLVGPSDSIKNKKGEGCAEMQPAQLNTVIAIQKEVSQAQRTLFWDWRAFMGGECAIQRWADDGDARPDLVHLSQNGYKKSADALFEQLTALMGR